MLETVLILEQDVTARKQLAYMVTTSGVQIGKVLECATGLETMEWCQKETVDLVLMNVNLPVLSGIEVIRQLKKLPFCPMIVVVSKESTFADMAELIRLGVRDYLLKNPDQQQVVSMLYRMEEEKEQHCLYQQFCEKVYADRLKQMMFAKATEETVVATAGVKREWVQQLKEAYYIFCGFISPEQMRQQKDIMIWTVNEKEQNVIVCSVARSKEILSELKNCTLGISTIHTGAEQLAAAYEEAWKARQQAFFRGKTIFAGKEYRLLGEGKEIQMVDLHSVEQAVNKIGTDKLEEAVNLLIGLIDCTRMGQNSVEQFEKQLTYFADRVSAVYHHVLHEMDDTGEEMRKFYNFQNYVEYQQYLIQWMYQLNGVIEEQFGDYKNKRKIQQALALIHENYNKNLNMAVVTNSISMNYSLFSHTFKQYVGSNFVDYLKNLRMGEAKKLLVETDMMIMDISRAVGYDNEKHFTKVFKAECGVSPSEYRKNMLYRV